jgi:hypothetical protein
MTPTPIELKAVKHTNNNNRQINSLIRETYTAGYVDALNDIQAVMGKTATNDISVLMGNILDFIQKQKGY